MMEIGPAGWVGAPKALRGLLPMRVAVAEPLQRAAHDRTTLFRLDGVAVAELLHRAAHDLGLHARKRQIRCQIVTHGIAENA